MKKNILIVDDEAEITDLLEVYLTAQGYSVFKFYQANGVLACIRKERIDLAILDVMLPDMDGFKLCKAIREDYFFPIIMLTAKIEETDKLQGILLGADDYITKPFQPLELMARVKAQLRRADTYNRAMSGISKEEFYEADGLEVNATTHICTLYGKEIELTPTEFSILLCLFRRRGQVLTSEEIFEEVWGTRYLDSNNTVFVHVARIREKLHENARKPKFIKTVWGVGYKMDKPGEHNEK